jgi:hypothetical protein
VEEPVIRQHAGQAPNPALLAQKVQRVLGANIGAQRIRRHLRFLDSSLLMRTIIALPLKSLLLLK